MEKLRIKTSLFYIDKGPFLYTRIFKEGRVAWYHGYVYLNRLEQAEKVSKKLFFDLESEFDLANGENL